MDRTELLRKKLIYLFSFDVDLARRRREAKLPGHPITSFAHHFVGEPEQPVYSALGEPRVMGEEIPAGHVEFMQETMYYLPHQQYADISGRVLFRAKDEQLIEADYEGVVRAGRAWLAVRNEYGGKQGSHIETKAHIHLRFETGSTKYRWLVKHQCVGYGKLWLHTGEPSFATFDIYAVDSS